MDSDSSYSDLTHRYSPPTPVSQSTAFYYRGHQQSTRNNNNAAHGSSSHHLPGVSDLANIKADLERVLTRAETRLRHLRKDFNHLDKDVKVRETGGKRERERVCERIWVCMVGMHTTNIILLKVVVKGKKQLVVVLVRTSVWWWKRCAWNGNPVSLDSSTTTDCHG